MKKIMLFIALALIPNLLPAANVDSAKARVLLKLVKTKFFIADGERKLGISTQILDDISKDQIFVTGTMLVKNSAWKKIRDGSENSLFHIKRDDVGIEVVETNKDGVLLELDYSKIRHGKDIYLDLAYWKDSSQSDVNMTERYCKVSLRVGNDFERDIEVVYPKNSSGEIDCQYLVDRRKVGPLHQQTNGFHLFSERWEYDISTKIYNMYTNDEAHLQLKNREDSLGNVISQAYLEMEKLRSNGVDAQSITKTIQAKLYFNHTFYWTTTSAQFANADTEGYANIEVRIDRDEKISVLTPTIFKVNSYERIVSGFEITTSKENPKIVSFEFLNSQAPNRRLIFTFTNIESLF